MIKTVCKYDKELEIFLKDVVEFTLKNYGADLNLSRLELIELMDIAEFDVEKDGMTRDGGTKIIVTSRLYECLPNYHINDLKENTEFQQIVNTMYHEMGHVTDWLNYPKLYMIATSDNDIEKFMPPFFWLEYLAEKRSCQKDFSGNMSICDQFIQCDWNPYEMDSTSAKKSNFFYLNKVLAYFLARVMNGITEVNYIDKIPNGLLKEYLNKLMIEIRRLENLLPFDDMKFLDDLHEIMDCYYKKFKQIFSPR